MLKRLDYRILFGVLLMLAGGLLLAERLGYVSRASDIFWGIALLLGGAAFVSMFIGGQWWAIIPGLTLVGVAGSILLPSPWSDVAGLAGVALSFWLIYLTKRDFWWAIIPAGVLTTLAVIAWLPARNDTQEGFILFLGLGLTFLLIALLGQRWAFWPALALAVFALFFGIPALFPYVRFADYIWPVALLLAGCYLIYAYIRKR